MCEVGRAEWEQPGAKDQEEFQNRVGYGYEPSHGLIAIPYPWCDYGLLDLYCL